MFPVSKSHNIEIANLCVLGMSFMFMLFVLFEFVFYVKSLFKFSIE